MAARNIAKKSTPRKAPGRREAKPAAPAPGTATTTVKPAAAPVTAEVAPAKGVGQRWEELKRYFEAVRKEFNRVTWPGDTNNFLESLTSKEMKGATMVVILTLVVFATYLGFLDVAFVRLFGWVHKG